MPYLVDGHNLIPKSGIRLDSVDDEMELINALQEFARLERREVDVYFDGAPPGSAGSRRFGRVSAHFVRAGSTADSAIRTHLKRLGGAARNWIVVSSDHEVQAAARAAHARSLPSEKFASLLRRVVSSGARGETKGADQDRGPTNEEIEHWLKMFKREE